MNDYLFTEPWRAAMGYPEIDLDESDDEIQKFIISPRRKTRASMVAEIIIRAPKTE